MHVFNHPLRQAPVGQPRAPRRVDARDHAAVAWIWPLVLIGVGVSTVLSARAESSSHEGPAYETGDEQVSVAAEANESQER